MCFFKTPKPPKVEAPVKYAQQKEPDGGMVSQDVRRRVTDQLRAYTATNPTGSTGVLEQAPTGANLLGQNGMAPNPTA